MIRGVLGSRASIGGVLGSGRGGAAAAWYLAGGVSAANCVAAYQPIGAASLAASYVNLASPGTFDAAPGTAPTFDTATGWTFNGSSQYLVTGIAPAAGYSMIVRFSGASTSGTRTVAGTVRISAPISRFYIRSVDAGIGRSYGYGTASTALDSGNRPALASGVLANVGGYGYANGTADIDSGGTWITTALGITIGAEQRDASITNYYSGNVLAVAIYNATLTAPQVAAISSAMSAL